MINLLFNRNLVNVGCTLILAALLLGCSAQANPDSTVTFPQSESSTTSVTPVATLETVDSPAGESTDALPEATAAALSAPAGPEATSPGPAIGTVAPPLIPTISPTAAPEPTSPAPTSAPANISIPVSPQDEDAYSKFIESLAWAEGATGDNASGLRSIKGIINADEELVTNLESLAWIDDGISDDEDEALDAIESLARRDATLAKDVMEYSWTTDGITELESTALFQLRSLAAGDRSLTKSIVALNWVKDGLAELELEALAEMKRLSDQDKSLALRVAGMPFFTDSIHGADSTALIKLRELNGKFPVEMKLLAGQDWYQDGLDDTEAVFLTVLRKHVVFDPNDPKDAADFATLVPQHFVDYRSVDLPLTGTVRLYAFRIDDRVETNSFMDQLQQSVLLIEELFGAALPENELILVFADTGESPSGTDWASRNVRTHMVVTPNTGDKDRFRTIIRSMAFFYWNGAQRDTPVKGVPLWFESGGRHFLGSYVFGEMDSPVSESLSHRRSFRAGFGRYCGSLGVGNIAKLVGLLEQDGFSEHRQSLQYSCQSWIGELFFLDLYDAIGHKAFSAAWNEIYLLTLEKGEPVGEQEIYDIFVSHTPTDKISQFKDIYKRWHGGDFID